jgi:hypothetical protein
MGMDVTLSLQSGNIREQNFVARLPSMQTFHNVTHMRISENGILSLRSTMHGIETSTEEDIPMFAAFSLSEIAGMEVVLATEFAKEFC